jgi:hypothetical protein
MLSLVFFKLQYASEANSTNHSKHFHYIFFKLRWQQETAKLQIRKPMTRSELEQKENKQIHLLLFYKQKKQRKSGSSYEVNLHP